MFPGGGDAFGWGGVFPGGVLEGGRAVRCFWMGPGVSRRRPGVACPLFCSFFGWGFSKQKMEVCGGLPGRP